MQALMFPSLNIIIFYCELLIPDLIINVFEDKLLMMNLVLHIAADQCCKYQHNLFFCQYVTSFLIQICVLPNDKYSPKQTACTWPWKICAYTFSSNLADNTFCPWPWFPVTFSIHCHYVHSSRNLKSIQSPCTKSFQIMWICISFTVH